MVGQYIALAATNKATAAAYAAKDFNYVFSTEKVASFFPQAQTFLSDIVEDLTRFRRLSANVSEIGYSMLRNDALINVIKGVYHLSDSDINDLMPPELLGQVKAAQQDYANSLAILANEVVRYTERLDDQAELIIKAWDATKKTDANAHIIGSITVVVDLLTALGIGGNATVQSIAKEFAEVTKGGAAYHRLWNGIGLRAGQVGDALQAAFNSGIWLDKLNNVKKISEVYDKVKDADVAIGENLKLLLERIKDYEEKERKRQEPSEPNPFIPL
jgi:hypothetical protein